MEKTIGIIIGLVIMLFIGSKMIKETKQPTWKWNGFTAALGIIYIAIIATLIYHLV